MALSILDGNQTATTLSTVISAGAHIPAHTVVSLGSQAITDMRGAVSGSVVSISNFPSTQTIAGTVTANIDQLSLTNALDFFAVNYSEAFPVSLQSEISGTVTPSLGIGGPYDFWSDENITIPNSAVAIGSIKNGLFEKVGDSNPLPISGTVTANITNSITVGSLPVQLSTTTIGGTARLNVTLSSATTVGATAPSYANLYGGSDGTNLRAISVDSSGRTVVTGSVNIPSTTVTVSALPSGALTTRFGSVTTANLAQISSAVTNTSRKYLLCQNISSGTVTIGIGFSPTTTQGIQLAAGAGLTFDAFCPTGAVYWLGATTGATWTIIEG